MYNLNTIMEDTDMVTEVMDMGVMVGEDIIHMDITEDTILVFMGGEEDMVGVDVMVGKI